MRPLRFLGEKIIDETNGKHIDFMILFGNVCCLRAVAIIVWIKGIFINTKEQNEIPFVYDKATWKFGIYFLDLPFGSISINRWRDSNIRVS